MAFVDGLNRMCKLNGTTPTALLRDLRLSTSKVTAWNNGSLPKERVMETKAERLNCHVSDFFLTLMVTCQRAKTKPNF